MVSKEEYFQATVDPVAVAALDIIPRINKKYSGALPEMCREYGGKGGTIGVTFLQTQKYTPAQLLCSLWTVLDSTY